MEKLQAFFYSNPHYFGLFFTALGALLLIGAILDWDWVFEGGGGFFNIASVTKYFSRNLARILMGILALLVILCGLFYFFMFRK